MLKKNIIAIFLCSFSFSTIASIHEKSRAGIFYDFSFNPQVSSLLDSASRSKQKNLHFLGISVDVPYNKYLTFGFSLDLFSTKSFLRGRALMGGGIVDLGAMGGIISGKIKPQLPFSFSFGDLLLFASFEGGIGGTPALVFGSHNLSRDDEYARYRKFPSPFPIVFNTGAKIGMEYYLYEIFGVELNAGYRVLWFVHPMVTKEHLSPEMIEAPPKSVVAYDLSSFFAGMSLKMAF